MELLGASIRPRASEMFTSGIIPSQTCKWQHPVGQQGCAICRLCQPTSSLSRLQQKVVLQLWSPSTGGRQGPCSLAPNWWGKWVKSVCPINGHSQRKQPPAFAPPKQLKCWCCVNTNGVFSERCCLHPLLRQPCLVQCQCGTRDGVQVALGLHCASPEIIIAIIQFLPKIVNWNMITDSDTKSDKNLYINKKYQLSNLEILLLQREFNFSHTVITYLKALCLFPTCFLKFPDYSMAIPCQWKQCFSQLESTK